MTALRARLALALVATLTGFILAVSGVVTDHVLPLLVGLSLLCISAALVGSLVPRDFTMFVRVTRLTWAILRRVEHRAHVAPSNVLSSKKLDSGALLVSLHYPVGSAPLQRRLDWAKEGLGVRANELFEWREVSARTIDITISSLGD